jgi:hypothetical protein
VRLGKCPAGLPKSSLSKNSFLHSNLIATDSIVLTGCRRCIRCFWLPSQPSVPPLLAWLLSSQPSSPVVVTKGDPMVHGWRGGHDRDATMSRDEGSSFQPPLSHVLQAKDALAVELKQAREVLQSASAGHAKEVSRLLQQLREASEVHETQIHEGSG